MESIFIFLLHVGATAVFATVFSVVVTFLSYSLYHHVWSTSENAMVRNTMAYYKYFYVSVNLILFALAGIGLYLYMIV